MPLAHPAEHIRSKVGDVLARNDRRFFRRGPFFGRELWNELKVPVGLISADWCGTPADAWTLLETLRSNSDYADSIKQYQEKALSLEENPNLGEELQKVHDDYMEKIAALSDTPLRPMLSGVTLARRYPTS